IFKTTLTRWMSRSLIPVDDADVEVPQGPPPKRPTRVTVYSVVRSILSGSAEHADTLMLNAVLGPAAAGTYRLAKSLASLPSRVSGPVWNALRPGIARAWSLGDRAEKLRAVGRPALAMLAAMAVVLPALYWYRSDLVVKIYGMQAVAAATPFAVL